MSFVLYLFFIYSLVYSLDRRCTIHRTRGIKGIILADNRLTCNPHHSDIIIGIRGGGAGGNCPPKFGEDQIRENSSGRIGKNKFLSVIKTEKFSKIGNDEQEFGY